jgi:hypothetical protein
LRAGGELQRVDAPGQRGQDLARELGVLRQELRKTWPGISIANSSSSAITVAERGPPSTSAVGGRRAVAVEWRVLSQ